ncbi:hypothetical protein SAMN05428949_2265 [Chitinophaga sp. YR627]|nr:hypothetical protein SAMN05428949_2265 [Chitinophaga sp. YR627]
MDYLAGVLLLSALGAIASSKKTTRIDICLTTPTTVGPSINWECPFSPAVQCCYISAGSTSQYVTQTQPSGTVSIRRSPVQMTVIFGLK